MNREHAPNKSVNFSAMIAVLLLMSPALRAQDSVATTQSEAAKPSVVGEAGKAIFGRVFGQQDQGGEIDYYVFDVSNHTRVNSTVRSALIPGWGQIFNKQRVKGWSLMITTTASLFGSVTLYRKSKDSFNDYEASGRINGPAYDDYESERVQAMVLGSLAVALWSFSVVDAYRNAYTPLWSKNHSMELVVLPEEAKVIWQRHF